MGYVQLHGGGNQPMLGGRRMLSISTSGAPTDWLKKEAGWQALRNLFDEHVAEVCGLTLLEHKHFGQVLKGAAPGAMGQYLTEVGKLARRTFG